jgi:TnpA family transposase
MRSAVHNDPRTGLFYSHLSDQYGYFSILPISPTESEAAYVLDGLFDQDTVLDIQEHVTDTGGASDHVFGLFALIGNRFAPRLRNLKDRKFHTKRAMHISRCRTTSRRRSTPL